MVLDNQQSKVSHLSNRIIQHQNVNNIKYALLRNRDFFIISGTTNSDKMPSNTKGAKVENLALLVFKLILYLEFFRAFQLKWRMFTIPCSFSSCTNEGSLSPSSSNS